MVLLVIIFGLPGGSNIVCVAKLLIVSRLVNCLVYVVRYVPLSRYFAFLIASSPSLLVSWRLEVAWVQQCFQED